MVPAGTSEVIEVFELLGEAHAGGVLLSGFLDLWNEARKAYVHGEFAAAGALFEAAAQLRPDDGPCRVMVQRCRMLAESGQAVAWDGIWRFDAK